MSKNNQNNDSMVEVVEREGISAVWLVPLIALIFGLWLIVKAVNERGIFITVQLDTATGIVSGKTPVKFKGLTVGTVKNVEVSDDLNKVDVEIEMLPATEDALTENAKFWYVTADVSFQGVSGLDTLLSGGYIQIRPDLSGKESKAQRKFIGLKEAPPLDESTPGLHITLTAESLGSVGKNSLVSFKQITVGHVVSHSYDDNSHQVNIHIFIEPEYAYLVKKNTRFWNASGFTLSGSLASGIQVKTESLATIITGGIAFNSPPFEAEAEKAENSDNFVLHKNYVDAEMGQEIRLVLGANANIDVGVPIVYQNITVGKVDAIENIDSDTRKITAIARVNPRVSRFLTTESQFYVERPQLDLGGVTNLHRMLTGAQIGVRPSLDGEPTNMFTVYNSKPAYKYSEPGLHLALSTDNIDSLHVGSGVFFKQQNVGSVQAIESVSPNEFLVHIFIKPEYQSYVSTDSRFWNVSGIRIAGNLQNFDIQLQSVQTLLQGGIAFDLGFNAEQDTKQQPQNGDKFALWANQDLAQERIAFELIVPSRKALSEGMRLMYRGEKAGSVHQISRYGQQFIARLGVLPEFEFILKDQSQFWLSKAKLSLSALNDTDALFGGSYFTVNVAGDKPAYRFNAFLTPPKKLNSATGLQVSLIADSADVASSGSPVSYKGINIGQVDNVVLNKGDNSIRVNLTIDQEYGELVTEYSRFYNASGITVKGGLSGLAMRTKSFDAMLTGGISLYNDEQALTANAVEEGAEFYLYSSFDTAQAAGTAITIYFNDLNGLKAGMPIKHKGQNIGLIDRLTFESEKLGVKTIAYLNDAGRKFAVAGTKFWRDKPVLGLVGSKNLDALIEAHIEAMPPSNTTTAESADIFYAEDIAPTVTALPYGLNITLDVPVLGSLRVGEPVLYKQVAVGEVIGIDLSPTAESVLVYLNIADKYAKLVASESIFWNASGMQIEAGLFSGIKVEAESVETILSGGIAFATPENIELTPVKQGQSFDVASEFKEEWRQWSPKVELR